ncbi:unnamed protein product [Musa acuminata var. zebrina]
MEDEAIGLKNDHSVVAEAEMIVSCKSYSSFAMSTNSKTPIIKTEAVGKIWVSQESSEASAGSMM